MEYQNNVGLNRDGSPYTEQECDEIIGKLEALLDGELNPNEQDEVEQLVNDCQYCLEQYNIEKSLRKLVRGGASGLNVSNKLISNIKNSISNWRNSGSTANS